MKKLPIGIQTFENLILEGYYYVDKTSFVQTMAAQGKYYPAKSCWAALMWSR